MGDFWLTSRDLPFAFGAAGFPLAPDLVNQLQGEEHLADVDAARFTYDAKSSNVSNPLGFVWREIQADQQASGVYLVIRMCPGVIDVLVVSVKLEVFAQRPKAPGKQSSVAPLGVLALVGQLGSSV